ncbi:hypothetical protein MD484_g5979, partial [Candolleomyces efflorescens]
MGADTMTIVCPVAFKQVAPKPNAQSLSSNLHFSFDMQFNLVAATLAVLATVASAIPNPPAQSCSTGPIQCCNSVQRAGAPSVATLLGLLGIVVQNANVPIGLTCTPITVIGAGGNSCTAQTVCCQNNSFNGVVAIGCTPINVNL